MSGAARKRRSTGQRAAAAAASQRSPGLGERNFVGDLLRNRYFSRLGDNGTEPGGYGNGLRITGRFGTSGGATKEVTVMLSEGACPSRNTLRFQPKAQGPSTRTRLASSVRARS